MPVALSSAPMAGATSPITMAGTLTQLHAEELAGIVFSQLLKPGAPVLYGGIPGMADMHDLSYKAGGVEFGYKRAGRYSGYPCNWADFFYSVIDAGLKLSRSRDCIPRNAGYSQSIAFYVSAFHAAAYCPSSVYVRECLTSASVILTVPTTRC